MPANIVRPERRDAGDSSAGAGLEARIQMADRWATFDCYGTLIDWEGGLRSAFGSLWPDADTDTLLREYHRAEPRIQADGGLTYREVLAHCLRAVADDAGLEIPPGREEALAEWLPSWSPFAEVPAALADARDRGWKLAALSNTDPDLLAASIDAIGVPFELRITAAEAGSYKPAPGHWERFFADSGADRDRHVHVAASLFHDIEPAQRLHLKAVWINRLDETSDLERAAELPDLRDLAPTLDRVAG
jgi:2-haloacid dehalogenase